MITLLTINWIGQKVSVRCYRKMQMNFLVNPVLFGFCLILNFAKVESYYVYLLLLRIMFLRFVCVDAHSCFIEFSYLTVPHPFIVHFNVNGHLDCFQSSVLMNNAL